MKIIFVCTGNTCRSPLAEGYLRTKKLPGIEVLSRGIFADGSPISENSLLVAREYGMDLSHHRSAQFSSSDLDADKIICMSQDHKNLLISAGINQDKVSVLGDGIMDPFGSDISNYRLCAKEIFLNIDKLVNEGFFLPFKTRFANEKDFGEIAQIENECFSTPWSENALLESFFATTKFIVAQNNEEIVGYVGISCVADEGYITNVAVKESFRKMGVGSLLINKVLELARDMHLQFVSLEVRKSNLNAISIYSKYNFLEVGVRKNFYTAPKEDAIIMTRRFT